MDGKLIHEDIEHIKIESLMVKLPADCGQTFVFQNEEWQITNENMKSLLLGIIAFILEGMLVVLF